MEVTFDFTIHDYQQGADRTVTLTLSEDQLKALLQKAAQQKTEELKKTKKE